jgi:hypothetical protein
MIIENDGPAIRATDYWQSEHASAGLCYLSGNAGHWRLLVPEAAEGLLAEMRTGRRATIEPSMVNERCWDIVFDDGSSSPYCLTIDKRQVDRAVETGRATLTVWTEASGCVLTLPCECLP